MALEGTGRRALSGARSGLRSAGPRWRSATENVRWLPLLALGAAAVIAVVLAVPYVSPSTDSTNALGLGGAAAAGAPADFGAQVGSQFHPLVIGVSTLLALLLSAPAALTGFEVIAVLVVLAVVYGIVRAGLHLGGWVVALAAVLFVVSRPELVRAATFAYIDIPFAAALLLAAALVAERPVANRIPVLLALLVAGLLRPESWSLGLLYLAFLFAAGMRGRDLALPGVLAVAPILIWLGLETLLEGDPFAGASGVREVHQARAGDPGLRAPELGLLADNLDINYSAPRFTLAMVLLAVGGVGWWVVRPAIATRRLSFELEQRMAAALALVALAVLGANLTERMIGLPSAPRFLIVAAICIVLLAVWTVVRLLGPRLGALALAVLAVVALPISSHLSTTERYAEQSEGFHDEQHRLITLVDSKPGAQAGDECERFGVSSSAPVDQLARARLDEAPGLIGLGYGVDPFDLVGVPDPAQPPPGVAVFVRDADGRWSLAACEPG